jgi:hypothetical protein
MDEDRIAYDRGFSRYHHNNGFGLHDRQELVGLGASPVIERSRTMAVCSSGPFATAPSSLAAEVMLLDHTSTQIDKRSNSTRACELGCHRLVTAFPELPSF